MSEPALTETELRVVREMIGEYRYEQERRRGHRQALSAGEKIVAMLVGLILVALQCATFLVTVSHLH